MTISPNEANHVVLQMLETHSLSFTEIVENKAFAKHHRSVVEPMVLGALSDLDTMKLVACDGRNFFLTELGRERLKTSKRGGKARL